MKHSKADIDVPGSSHSRSLAFEPHAPAVNSPTLITVAATIAALYFGRDVFLPLAVAVLFTFALAPVVSWLRRFVPKPFAVISVVVAAFGTIAIFAIIVTMQLGVLASNLPRYQFNIEAKIRTVKEASPGEGAFNRLYRLVERLGAQIAEEEQAPAAPLPGETEPKIKPLPVEVVEPALKPRELLRKMIGPLIAPLTTGGIIIVVVIFMLMNREDLRDRFIRLVGANDLHRTTEALLDAARRVGRYLLMQLVVNFTYAVPIGIGLWLIGVPNAMLWALLALVLRFVPYVGPIIAAFFPLALAFAVDPGWTMLAWTLALFVVVELVSNNAIEPWLYGTRTGLSPLAIIVAAIFWTWLWGPLGLLLSTPLTVCLVVLGRHVPQFAFLDVLFGSEPVLEPHEALYQRLLAGDPAEATDRAEEFLNSGVNDLVDFYETVAIPALALGEQDRARGVMDAERRSRVATGAMTLVDNLEDHVDGEVAEEEDEAEDSDEDVPDGTGKVVLCVGGRGDLDEASAAMLAQVLSAHGATARLVETAAIAVGNIDRLDLDGVHAVVIAYLNADSRSHARYSVRRIKRAAKNLRVGVVFWRPANEAPAAETQPSTIGADFVAYTIAGAIAGALSDEPAIPTKAVQRRLKRGRKPVKNAAPARPRATAKKAKQEA